CLNGLALCGGDKPGKAVHLLLCEFEKLEQHARAALGVRRRPGELSGLRIGDGSFHLRLVREGDLGLDLAGIGVEYVAAASRGAGDGLAANEMSDLAHGVPPLTAASSRCRSARAASRLSSQYRSFLPGAKRGLQLLEHARFRFGCGF